MVGKWHCGDQPEFLPTSHGFDHYFGLPYSNDMGRQAGTPTGADGDQAGYPPLPLLDDDEVIEQQPDQAVAHRALRRRGAALHARARRDEPFFLYLAHLYVHLPIYVPGALRRGVAQRPATARRSSRSTGPTAVILDELERAGPRRAHHRDLHQRQRRARARTTAAATCRCAAARAPPGRAACGCRASCAGPAGSRRAAPATSSSPRWTCSRPSPRWPAPRCPRDRIDRRPRPVGGPARRRRASPREVVRLLLDGRPVRGAVRPLEAARRPRRASPVEELYDLLADPGETRDVARSTPRGGGAARGPRGGLPP